MNTTSDNPTELLNTDVTMQPCNDVTPPCPPDVTHRHLTQLTKSTHLTSSDATPWPDPVNGADLLTELASVLRRFVVLPPSAAEALALWIVHTYAFQLRDITTYIGVESPQKRCGKTTLLSLLQTLVNLAPPPPNIP